MFQGLIAGGIKNNVVRARIGGTGWFAKDAGGLYSVEEETVEIFVLAEHGLQHYRMR